MAALRAALRQFPSVSEARIFGSRITGGARRASDADLAIFAPNATTAEWSSICEELEKAPLIYEIDIVRADQSISERLKAKIERDGIVIYPDGK